MDSDFSVEMGGEDPVLDFPWTDPDGKLKYVDLKRHPELLAHVEEAKQFPTLAEFLRLLNSPISHFESAKCDAWSTVDLTPEEEIFGASQKFASYVDLVFSRDDHRRSFPVHERFAQELVALLRRTPEMPSSAEVIVRRAYFAGKDGATEGCYFTLYINGYGDEESRARQNWEIALLLVANAILQLSLR